MRCGPHRLDRKGDSVSVFCHAHSGEREGQKMRRKRRNHSASFKAKWRWRDDPEIDSVRPAELRVGRPQQTHVGNEDRWRVIPYERDRRTAPCFPGQPDQGQPGDEQQCIPSGQAQGAAEPPGGRGGVAMFGPSSMKAGCTRATGRLFRQHDPRPVNPPPGNAAVGSWPPRLAAVGSWSLEHGGGTC